MRNKSKFQPYIYLLLLVFALECHSSQKGYPSRVNSFEHSPGSQIHQDSGRIAEKPAQ